MLLVKKKIKLKLLKANAKTNTKWYVNEYQDNYEVREGATQPAFTCSKSTMETVNQCVKYFQR